MLFNFSRAKMSASQTSFLSDGFSTNCPPQFEGQHFGEWKNKIELLVKSINLQLWIIITDGPKEVKSSQGKWSDDDIKAVQLNSQAINIMYCALRNEEFNHISSYKSAKEIWDKLVITHEGTSLVKTSKINMLKHH